MRIAVASCWEYRDAWEPFFKLFHMFWPEHYYSYPLYLVTRTLPVGTKDTLEKHLRCLVFESGSNNWCQSIADFSAVAQQTNDPVLLLQEDFFLNDRVRQNIIEQAIRIVHGGLAGCVRLYPVPGPDRVDEDIKNFGIVDVGSPYRISCQAAVWDPSYLNRVAKGSMSTTGEAGDFENLGTQFSNGLPERVLAFNRDGSIWPIQYLATAITRGRWNPDAIRLCNKYGIELDRSMREVCS